MGFFNKMKSKKMSKFRADFGIYYLSDVDGWLLAIKNSDGYYSAPFSLKIDESMKDEKDLFLNDITFENYFNETLYNNVNLHNLVYKSKNLLKTEEYKIFCLGAYSKFFGLKLFNEPKFVSDVKFEVIEKKGGDNNEEKKMAKND